MERGCQPTKSNQDAHLQVRAQNDRVAERERGSLVIRHEVLADGQQGHREPDQQIDEQKQAPVPGGADHGHQNDGECEPVGQVHHAEHPFVGRPEAPLNTDAETCREHRGPEHDGEQDQKPGAGWTVRRLEESEQHPADEQDLDQRSRVQRLPDHEGEYGLGADDEGRQQDQDDPHPDDVRQDALRRPRPDGRASSNGRQGGWRHAGGVALCSGTAKGVRGMVREVQGGLPAPGNDPGERQRDSKGCSICRKASERKRKGGADTPPFRLLLRLASAEADCLATADPTPRCRWKPSARVVITVATSSMLFEVTTDSSAEPCPPVSLPSTANVTTSRTSRTTLPAPSAVAAGSVPVAASPAVAVVPSAVRNIMLYSTVLLDRFTMTIR